jgi:hypothetical protein
MTLDTLPAYDPVANAYHAEPAVLPARGADEQPLKLSILASAARDRGAVEKFIQDRYASNYGASLTQFHSLLLKIENERAQIHAALGFHYLGSDPVFLERYLSQPVQEALAHRAGLASTPGRDALVEVGNFAARTRGGARHLVAALTAYLHSAGAEWAVFTAVGVLRNTFSRLGIRLVEIAPATREALPATERAGWGRYYDTNPWVVAANVRQAHEALGPPWLPAQDTPAWQSLWFAAAALGSVHGERFARD